MKWPTSQRQRKTQIPPTLYLTGYNNYYAQEPRKKTRKISLLFVIVIAFMIVGFLRLVLTSVEHSVNATQPNIFGIKISTEKSRAAVAKAAELTKSNEELHSLVNNFAQPYDKKVSVVVTDLSNGASASINADKQLVSASLYKLFVAYGVYKKVDTSSITLSQSLTKYGSNQTISQCLSLMITVSDNDCGVALGKLVGWAALDRILASEDYTGTILNNYYANGVFNGKDKLTTAKDVALLLNRLHNGTLLQPNTTKLFTDLLKAQEKNEFLPSGLPETVTLAHKTGDLYGYIHDAGILYSTNKNMVVVLMSGEWQNPNKEAPPVFAKLSKAVLAYTEQ